MSATVEPLRDSIARSLRAEIISGELVPGTRILEHALAEQHGVSRVPAREALQLLAHEGFIEIVPRRGATVALPSPRRTRELMVIRQNLEELAARLAAERQGAPVAAELRSVLKQGSSATARKQFDHVAGLVDRFHELVAQASGNAELATLLQTVRSQVSWIFEYNLEQRSPDSWRHHALIAEAILQGDPEAAAAAMREDVVRDEKLLFEILLTRD
ncbi:GntR family transcriptional regulator [Jatrophihabitans sp. GAS493]|uniref:GntR family transcriptional regulator n=1 Tax=Jatrophihabitans sp. GAS493 TaxID=1907575 RepID=UPI00156039DC|nr:GntR family transcriptional regulator [Jatrophihabitans sp. GAS493]